ncbi:hypothetical protein [Pelosinus baikalensis]|uniref:Uncharacterized protein n=1 Tax=Pelosinus baikalensis TaxID=2892015 RepID=A0ABS8HWP2_9FIRM|nr:hypothetical protein [Pelosinus baikalensis]MCC5467583.1 hypothetical protein [Pelosinus baikalensis]
MGGENEVCLLHGEISRELSTLNKDIGKVSERVVKVEENTKLIPDIAKSIEELKNEKNRAMGFIAGVSFVVSGIVSVAAWLISMWIQKGP